MRWIQELILQWAPTATMPAAWLASGLAGADQRTPNLAAVLQEIVDRPGWTAGNSLVIIITAFDSVDIAVDPIDGTRLLSLGLPNALSVVAVAERGSMFSPGHLVYMDKLAVGPAARGKISMNMSVRENLEAVARAKDKNVNDLTAVVLDRPRNSNYVTDIRACGARLKLITDGDVAAAVSTALEGTGVDILFDNFKVTKP